MTQVFLLRPVLANVYMCLRHILSDCTCILVQHVPSGGDSGSFDQSRHRQSVTVWTTNDRFLAGLRWKAHGEPV